MFLVIRFIILIVGFTMSIRNTRNSTSFSKNMYMSGYEISSGLIFFVLSIASELNPKTAGRGEGGLI